MSDNFAATPGSGATFGMDEVVDGTLGTVKVGFGKIMDGTLDSTNKLIVNSSGEALTKDTTARSSLASIDGKAPALGQALAAASVPVILPSATITTLTPPAAITGYALDAHLTDKSQFTKLTDGTDTALISAAGELAVLPSAQPGVDIGDVTINNATGAAAVNIQDGGNSITVDGTVTANAGTNLNTSALALDAHLTDKSQFTKLTDGTDTAAIGTSGDQVVSISNPTSLAGGIYATLSPFGSLNVSTDATSLFADTFEGVTVDTTNRWTSSGTVPPTQVNGVLSVNPSTTASATSVLASQFTFTQATAITVATSMTFEAAATLGNHRFFGMGTAPAGTGTAAAPLQDAIGFEIDTAGVFRASVYNNGSRVSTTALTKPVDAASHRLAVVIRGDVAFWYMDSFDLPLATSAFTPSIQTLPIRLASLNSASVTVGTPTMTSIGVGLFDQARTGTAISDGVYQWRKATVDKNNRLITTNYARTSIVPFPQLTLTTTAETTLVAAVAAQFNDILSIVCINTSATATRVDFRDSTAGTIRFSLYCPAGDTRGISLTAGMPQAAVNNNWTAQCSVGVSSIIITGQSISSS